MDLIWATRHLIRRSPIKWSYRHVDGHVLLLNPHLTYDDLDRWQQLNEDMDLKAKLIRLSIDHSRPPQQAIYGEPWALYDGNSKICKDPVERLTMAVEDKECLQYWEEKGKFGSVSPTEVD